MTSDKRIAAMQRRIHRWLHTTATEHTRTPVGTMDGLEADIEELETEMRALFPHKGADRKGFEALRDQAMFRTVLESVVEGIIVADMEGRLLIFNSAARELLGEGPTEGSPDEWSETYGLFYPDGKTLYPAENLPLSRALQGEDVDGDELIVRSAKRPEDIYVLSTARPLHEEDGTQIGAVVVFHDITESKQVERKLRKARRDAEDANRTKSEFLANMSHEIRTPLTAVLGFTDLLMDGKLNESDKLNYIQAVRRNGEHLLALINDVLDISKIQANKLQVDRHDCALGQILHETASVIQVRAHEKGLDFNLAYETPLPALIESDAMRLRQILLNLLSNAVKFTHQGQVKLTARCVDIGMDSSRVEFEVSDTGIGMSKDELEELFQPFQQAAPSTTREFGGTGLGLAICRSLAEALGGEIRARSLPGEGSTFTFILYYPLDEQTEMVAEQALSDDLPTEASTAPTAKQLHGRVLLAEDGVDNQLLISTILRKQGLEVDIAENGKIAVSEVLHALETGTPYDLVLMDMQMPKLDGYGATAKLRSKGYSGPILALTAHAMRGERARCIQAGCDDYLTKPIARAVLLAAVEAHLVRTLGGESEPKTAEPRNMEGVDKAGQKEAIYSIYAMDPEMEELVAGFVERLPQQLEAIRSAAEQGNSELVKRLAHQTKGAAGGYGFMPLSEEAAALEEVARTATQTSEVDAAVQRFASLCRRVRHASDTGDKE